MREIALPVRLGKSSTLYDHVYDATGRWLCEAAGPKSGKAIADALNDHAALEAQVEALRAERDRLQGRIDAATAIALQLKTAVGRLTAERNRLREQVAAVRALAGEWRARTPHVGTSWGHVARELRAIVGGAAEGGGAS